MATLRQIIDKIRPVSAIDLSAYGTSEGVTKAWDSRGRGRTTQGGCLGPNCDNLKEPSGQSDIPHVDSIELEMSSNKGGENLNFTKAAVKAALQRALNQLSEESDEGSTISFVNTPGQSSIDHYVSLRFDRAKLGIMESARDED